MTFLKAGKKRFVTVSGDIEFSAMQSHSSGAKWPHALTARNKRSVGKVSNYPITSFIGYKRKSETPFDGQSMSRAEAYRECQFVPSVDAPEVIGPVRGFVLNFACLCQLRLLARS